jgi:hypothetical protein
MGTGTEANVVEVLRDIEGKDEWNSYNRLIKAKQTFRKSPALSAFGEAMEWLY